MDNKKKKIIDLASLYPKAKTYDELLARQKEVHLRTLSRQPKFVPLSTSVSLSIAVIVLIVALENIWSFMYFGPIAGVPFIVLFCFIWIGFTWWQFKRIATFLNDKGISMTPFAVTYFMTVIPLLRSLYFILDSRLTIAAVYLILAAINIIWVNCLIAIVTNNKQSDNQKLGTLLLVIGVCLAFSIIATVI